MTDNIKLAKFLDKHKDCLVDGVADVLYVKDYHIKNGIVFCTAIVTPVDNGHITFRGIGSSIDSMTLDVSIDLSVLKDAGITLS